MAYTGSGTQDNPYVVTTGMSLIYLLENYTGVYIKIANDIDFSEEEDYSGKITHSLVISGSHIYADTPKNIYGLTVEGNQFFYAGTVAPGYGYLENVNLLNCVFKQANLSSGNGGLFDGNNSSWGIEVTNCKFSFVAALGAFTTPIFSFCKFFDCSVYVKVINSAYSCPWKIISQSSNYTMYVKFTRSNIVIDSMKMYPTGAGDALMSYGDYANWYTTFGADTSSIIYTNCDIRLPSTSTECYAIQTQGAVPSQFDGSYLAIINSTIKNSDNVDITAFHSCNYPMTGTTSIIATDIQGITISDTTSCNIKAIPTSDLTDINYLLSIGFLP